MQKTIDPDKIKNLVEIIDQTCQKFSSRTAFSNMGFEMTFSEIDEASKKMAAFYQSELKLKKGDRIILMMPNLLQYPIALFGAVRAGLVIVNTNPLYTATEMQKTFADSGATAIVILENFADKLEQIIGQTAIKHVVITEIGDCFPTIKRTLVNFVIRHVKKMVPPNNLQNTIRFRDALARGAHLPFKAPEITNTDLLFLQYTGGTTGVSKAAMLTHRNLIANMYQMLEIMKTKLTEGDEVVIAALPLYHIFCLTVNCFGLFSFGSHNILITNPKDIPAFIKTLEKTNPSVMIVVSTLSAALMNHPLFASLKLTRLKATVAGGMALKRSVADEWKARTNTPIIEGYGLTEASPLVSCNLLDGSDRIGTIGMPAPSTEIKIVDESGNEVAMGEAGELWARGPQVMKGYWNKPEETAKTLTPDGWLKTGDIAAMDADGYFKIMDRKKDMIIVSGFNVYPNEVEDVIMQNPKVMDAAAIGVEDAHSGEVVKLFIVKRDATLTEEEVKKYCREKLTAYKCPKHVEFRAELPKTNVGKILRRELR